MNGSRKGLFLLKTFLIMMETSSLSRSFSDKYGCQTSFLEYYQIISAIPNRLLTKAKDTATKEFYFNFISRIIVTNRELLKFGINEHDECIYCGQNDFIDHTLIACSFTRRHLQKTFSNGSTQQTSDHPSNRRKVIWCNFELIR